MPTDYNPTLFEFAPIDGRRVVAASDGGAITSDASALLLGETDRGDPAAGRFAAYFIEARVPELVEHEISTMVLQRVVGTALGLLKTSTITMNCGPFSPASLRQSARSVRR